MNEKESMQGNSATFSDKLRAFLARKDIVFSGKRYGIDALGAMALGLFGSLLIATIFNAIGLIPWLSFFKTIGGYGAQAAGCAMAVAIAYALKAPPLVIYSAALVGMIANAQGGAGGPLAVLLIAIVAVEFGKAVSRETKVDILVTPFVTVFVGGGLAVLFAGYIGKLVSYIGSFIGWATLQQPFVMGVIVSVVIGIALTLPISSAAICAAIGLSGAAVGGVIPENAEGLALAGGAAIAGCCAHMVGFAVSSFRENKWSGLISQGIGTSMLQIPNIMRKPVIMVPEIVASMFSGLVAVLMGLRCNAAGGGMGTSGLVGVFGTVDASMGAIPDWQLGLGIVLCLFVIPAGVSLLVSEILRKFGVIKFGDQSL